jgi:serine/threonine protein kinase/formylglycine-generating enzyme required for sulfatase activity
MNQHPAYELFEELGRGVNTVVFRSYDLSLGREVAIKELDENSRRDPRQREQFLREAQFLAQFEHDNVLRVYSVDTERGWIVMELMKGTLASIIAAGPSDPDLVRSVLKQTLDALAFLHEKDKVHGTVRPTNLLINDTGRVKLSEFEQTAAGGELRAPKGSKKYLAPELIKPEFGDFGPPLDLYCLAFTALEMLKGPQFESLFPGTGKGAIDADIAWLRWHSSPEDLASTKKLVKNIPDDLAHVLDRMLKKRVADRPQSAQEVLKELADRPLIAVPIAGVEDAGEGAADDRHLAPGVVRTISAPQTFTPRGASPAVNVGGASTPQHAASGKTARPAKAATSSAKPAPPRYSKDWFNQQLGRPYVLYPLCAVILLGALLFSFGNPFGGPSAPAVVPVTFDVQPDAKGLEVMAGKVRVPAKPDGKYPFPPGRHSLTLNKEGFTPVKRDIDVSPTSSKFAVKFEPLIKFVDVAIQVTPPDAELKVAGTKQSLTKGAYTHKLQEGQPLQVEATLDKYSTIARTISPDELKTLNNKVSIELEKEKAKLPDSIAAKPGAAVDPATQLPTRILASRLGDAEPLELVLVKPGSYAFGAPEDKKRPSELIKRSVRIDQPYYIAIHETTNAQYQKFFEAAGEAKAGSRWQAASRKWAGPQNVDHIKNHLPVTNVSVEQAQAFCTWVGGELPTEIEWECAVRGADDKGFPLPWGSGEPNRDRCRIFYGERLERGEGGPVPVEQLSAGASPLGLTHAIGNAAEWCHDSDTRGNFILRGCSIATANINDVRVTWRAKGDVNGEESSGFRVVIPIAAVTTPAPMTAAR